MRVLIAMDSFKGNMSSLDVAGIVEKGIRRVFKSDVYVDKVAIADGGEGTVDAIVNAHGGQFVTAEVTGPLGEKVAARYGIILGKTAIIEMAEASGLYLIPDDRRDPLKTTTFGVGELILDAIGRGCTKIVMGIGGSATNDGGAGMAAALGVRFLTKEGREPGFGGGPLAQLDRIDASGLEQSLAGIEFLVACDVNNPLYGEKGASRVFGPQKGASPEMVEILDKNLEHYAELIKRDLNKDVGSIPGSGAAGGLGGGLMAFCNAKLSKGIDIVLDEININERISHSDVVITGEGRIDGQTAHGKVPVGVAARAKMYGKPVFAIAGFIDKGAELVYEHGIDSVMSSMVGPLSLDEAIKQSPRLIEEASERLFRVIGAFWKPNP